jgi:hypothetical protein
MLAQYKVQSTDTSPPRHMQFDLIDAKELAPLAELNEPILKEAL